MDIGEESPDREERGDGAQAPTRSPPKPSAEEEGSAGGPMSKDRRTQVLN